MLTGWPLQPPVTHPRVGLNLRPGAGNVKKSVLDCQHSLEMSPFLTR